MNLLAFLIYSLLRVAYGELLTCSRESCPVVDSQELKVLEKIKKWVSGEDGSLSLERHAASPGE